MNLLIINHLHPFQGINNKNKSNISEKKNQKRLQSPGIEPGSTAWQAAIIPLNQDCYLEKMV